MRHSVAAAALAVALACSSSDTPPAPAPATSVEGFCAAAVPAWCRWKDACKPGRADETAQECIATNVPACQADFAVLGREVRAGRFRWDPARAQRCLDALTAPRCGGVLLMCTELFLPAVDPGGTCYEMPVRTDLASVSRTDECRGWGTGESTEGRQCPVDVCGGTCPVPVPIGAPCGPYARCGADAYCTWNGGTSTCQPRKAEAAPCGTDLECAEELWCRAPGGAGCGYSDFACTCAADLAADDPCTSDFQCHEPLVCRDGICRSETGAAGQSCYPFRADPPQCEPGLVCLRISAAQGTCGTPRAEGEPCLEGGDCADGLLCRTEGRCGRPSSEGGPCAPRTAENWSAYEGDCAKGLSCIGTSCIPTPDAPGEACDPPTTYCYGAGVSCSPILLQCEAVALEPGASCTASGMCAWDRGLYCDGLVCREAGGGGAPCTASRECLSSRCGPDGRCVAWCGW